MTVSAGTAGPRLVEGILGGRQDMHRHTPHRRIGFQRSTQVVATAVSQHGIGDDQVWALSLGGGQGLVQGASGHHCVVLTAQDH
jgi:hypothetical protein